MKLWQSIGALGLVSSQALNDQLTESVGGTKLCGFFTGDSVHLTDSIEIE